MPIQPRRSSRRPVRWPLLLLIVLAAIVLGLGVDASDDGRVYLPWPGGGFVLQVFGDPEEPVSHEGLIAVPMSARRIAAYSQVRREDIWDVETSSPKVAWLPAATIEAAGIESSLQSVIGRVLAGEKSMGYVFTAGDFLPEGTRPGLVAGIPMGKRALRINLSEVNGLVGLSPGDHFDLLATVPLDESIGFSDSLFSGPFAEQMKMQAALGNLNRQASVRLLVDNGVIVSPLENRMVPVTSTSLTGGTTTRTRPVQELVIAISPEEVPRLVESLGLELKILCVPRTGLPEAAGGDGVTPSSEPSFPFWAPFGSGDGEGSMSLIETIDGDQRTLRPVPRSKN
ncbi:MAG: hypothetical protein ACI9EF_002408 [Pseudohongiellaceae bacterium]|jgi:hypothetical protein